MLKPRTEEPAGPKFAQFVRLFRPNGRLPSMVLDSSYNHWKATYQITTSSTGKF